MKGFAVNNDGANKVGFTAPSMQGQLECISQAYHQAGCKPSTISYLEAHGTGTQLGDPIEIEALKHVFANDQTKGEMDRPYCAIGSVKTNVGHADAAAGVAGFIKTVLCLYNKQLVPHLHYHKSSQQINFNDSPFYVNTSLIEWPKIADNIPRRAGISSFGIGGTNAHIVVEEAPEQRSSTSRDIHAVTLSAKTAIALNEMKVNLSKWLMENCLNKSNEEKIFADMIYTLQIGRKVFPFRYAFICKNASEAIAQLESLENHTTIANVDVIQDSYSLLRMTARSWVNGVKIHWKNYYRDECRLKIPLPTYPFQRQRHWVDSKPVIKQPEVIQKIIQINIECIHVRF